METLEIWKDPIHRYEVSKMVSGMLRVKTASIFPASMTSAFVGYADKEKFYEFLLKGPKYNTMDCKVQMSRYEPEEEVKTTLQRMMQLLSYDMFPLV
jgi:hypothetical protein